MMGMPQQITVFQIAKLRRWVWDDGVVTVTLVLPSGEQMTWQGSVEECDRWIEQKGYKPMEQTR